MRRRPSKLPLPGRQAVTPLPTVREAPLSALTHEGGGGAADHTDEEILYAHAVTLVGETTPPPPAVRGPSTQGGHRAAPGRRGGAEEGLSPESRVVIAAANISALKAAARDIASLYCREATRGHALVRSVSSGPSTTLSSLPGKGIGSSLLALSDERNREAEASVFDNAVLERKVDVDLLKQQHARGRTLLANSSAAHIESKQIDIHRQLHEHSGAEITNHAVAIPFVSSRALVQRKGDVLSVADARQRLKESEERLANTQYNDPAYAARRSRILAAYQAATAHEASMTTAAAKEETQKTNEIAQRRPMMVMLTERKAELHRLVRQCDHPRQLLQPLLSLAEELCACEMRSLQRFHHGDALSRQLQEVWDKLETLQLATGRASPAEIADLKSSLDFFASEREFLYQQAKLGGGNRAMLAVSPAGDRRALPQVATEENGDAECRRLRVRLVQGTHERNTMAFRIVALRRRLERLENRTMQSEDLVAAAQIHLHRVHARYLTALEEATGGGKRDTLSQQVTELEKQIAKRRVYAASEASPLRVTLERLKQERETFVKAAIRGSGVVKVSEGARQVFAAFLESCHDALYGAVDDMVDSLVTDTAPFIDEDLAWRWATRDDPVMQAVANRLTKLPTLGAVFTGSSQILKSNWIHVNRTIAEGAKAIFSEFADSATAMEEGREREKALQTEVRRLHEMIAELSRVTTQQSLKLSEATSRASVEPTVDALLAASPKGSRSRGAIRAMAVASPPTASAGKPDSRLPSVATATPASKSLLPPTDANEEQDTAAATISLLANRTRELGILVAQRDSTISELRAQLGAAIASEAVAVASPTSEPAGVPTSATRPTLVIHPRPMASRNQPGGDDGSTHTPLPAAHVVSPGTFGPTDAFNSTRQGIRANSLDAERTVGSPGTPAVFILSQARHETNWRLGSETPPPSGRPDVTPLKPERAASLRPTDIDALQCQAKEGPNSPASPATSTGLPVADPAAPPRPSVATSSGSPSRSQQVPQGRNSAASLAPPESHHISTRKPVRLAADSNSKTITGGTAAPIDKRSAEMTHSPTEDRSGPQGSGEAKPARSASTTRPSAIGVEVACQSGAVTSASVSLETEITQRSEKSSSARLPVVADAATDAGNTPRPSSTGGALHHRLQGDDGIGQRILPARVDKHLNDSYAQSDSLATVSRATSAHVTRTYTDSATTSIAVQAEREAIAYATLSPSAAPVHQVSQTPHGAPTITTTPLQAIRPTEFTQSIIDREIQAAVTTTSVASQTDECRRVDGRIAHSPASQHSRILGEAAARRRSGSISSHIDEDAVAAWAAELRHSVRDIGESVDRATVELRTWTGQLVPEVPSNDVPRTLPPGRSHHTRLRVEEERATTPDQTAHRTEVARQALDATPPSVSDRLPPCDRTDSGRPQVTPSVYRLADPQCLNASLTEATAVVAAVAAACRELDAAVTIAAGGRRESKPPQFTGEGNTPVTPCKAAETEFQPCCATPPTPPAKNEHTTTERTLPSRPERVDVLSTTLPRQIAEEAHAQGYPLRRFAGPSQGRSQTAQFDKLSTGTPSAARVMSPLQLAKLRGGQVPTM